MNNDEIKDEIKNNEIVDAMTCVISLFLNNNKKELKLDKCKKCGADSSISMRELSSEIAVTIYYLLRCKKIL